MAIASTASAVSLRIASANDPQSLDPHALALLYQSRVVSQVYDSLVNRDRDFKLEPSLALSWQAVDAHTWRFKLRPNVLFHDGKPFTADDVVFSIERALARTSQRAIQLRGVKGARRVDATTIDILLETPDAVLPEKLLLVGMMSKAWAAKHGVLAPQDYNAKQETWAVRNANGTGPYRVRSYESDNRVVLVAHDRWWGKRGNVDEAVFLVITSDATRLAALASGQVDFVIDPPFQDVGRLKRDPQYRTVETADIGTQYLGFDQARDKLPSSSLQGRNPFKDVRVRQAFAHAIDADAIVARVLRGQGAPTGSFVSKLVGGYDPALDRRLPYDPVKARALLTDAGYPGGFDVTLDCVSITWRAAACQAIAGMLAQVGVKVTFQSSSAAQFFPKLTQATSSFFEFGWTPTTDAWTMLNATVHSFSGGSGVFNGGRYANPTLDAVIDAIRVEPDPDRRRALVRDALAILDAELPLIPLYRRTLAWVMRKDVDVAIWPNDILELRFVRIARP
ncbi:MAG: ABC transporter substrate-binding protein [Betaproteobacteria bacterium]